MEMTKAKMLTTTTLNSKTRSEQCADDVCALLRARNSFLWVVTGEEARVEGYLFEAAAAAGYVTRTWDIAGGVCDLSGKRENIGSEDPGETLGAIMGRSKQTTESMQERGAWIMRDLPAMLNGPGAASTVRQIRNLARSLPAAPRATAQSIIVITTEAKVPNELAGHATVINWPLPDRDEIAAILDTLVEQYGIDLNGQRDASIDAAVGLSGEEAQSCYSRSLVETKTIEPARVAKEKKRVVERNGGLKWYDPIPGGLAAVGGLDNLKNWLMLRAKAYTAEARAYGLPAPKGTLLVGIPGCGKTYIAKAIATAWQVPLLWLDLGALKGSLVGQSESNLRRVFETIAAIGRCVVVIDEVEKALQGATSGSRDGGVSSDALGALLSWMQERQGEAFLIATSNDVSGLPPEFLRKGRFDELWFVDLPNTQERAEIVKVSLRSHGRDASTVDVDAVALACDTFTGSEIAALVPDALFAAFNDGGREPTTDDLVKAAGSVVPLAETAKEKIERLRTWASTRARNASAKVEQAAPKAKAKARMLDIA
jgi:ATPase family associated with various cellular activities (AAA)